MTASEVLSAVERSVGVSYRLEGRCPGGEVGAYYARDPEGQGLVFKWFEDPGRLGDLELVVQRIDQLRSRGYPAPKHLPPLAFEGGGPVPGIGARRLEGRGRP